MASASAVQAPQAPTADILKSPAFLAWKRGLNMIAKREGLVPAAVTFPGEMAVWVEHFQAGKTPQQAWDAVPYGRHG